MKRLPALSKGPSEYHFVYTLMPKEYYPRIHFICEYSQTHVIISFHQDLSQHNSIKRSDILMQWHKTINEYRTLYPKLIKLKEMRNSL